MTKPINPLDFTTGYLSAIQDIRVALPELAEHLGCKRLPMEKVDELLTKLRDAENERYEKRKHR